MDSQRLNLSKTSTSRVFTNETLALKMSSNFKLVNPLTQSKTLGDTTFLAFDSVDRTLKCDH